MIFAFLGFGHFVEMKLLLDKVIINKLPVLFKSCCQSLHSSLLKLTSDYLVTSLRAYFQIRMLFCMLSINSNGKSSKRWVIKSLKHFWYLILCLLQSSPCVRCIFGQWSDSDSDATCATAKSGRTTKLTKTLPWSKHALNQAVAHSRHTLYHNGQTHSSSIATVVFKSQR